MTATMCKRWMLVLVVTALLVGGCGGGGGDNGAEGDDALDAAPTTGDRTVQVVGAGKVRLFGTLSVPAAAAGASVPGVLLVPSAGQGDRNGPISPTGEFDGMAGELARAFADAGLASLRYDRRGTGESRLDPETPLTFDDQVADARAGLDLLAQRKETAGKDLAVVGYDQGALVALRLAATDNRVKRLVLISAPGRSVVDIQAAALAARYGPESEQALRAAVAGLLATRSLPPLDTMRTELRPLLPPQDAGFLADVYGMDPVVEAAGVKVPTLIVVPRDAGPYDPARLAGALAASEVVTAPAAGPTLVITGPPPTGDDPSNPSNPAHEHGTSAPMSDAEWDFETIGRVSTFLNAGSTGRRP